MGCCSSITSVGGGPSERPAAMTVTQVHASARESDANTRPRGARCLLHHLFSKIGGGYRVVTVARLRPPRCELYCSRTRGLREFVPTIEPYYDQVRLSTVSPYLG
jgi:hypothetical protein